MFPILSNENNLNKSFLSKHNKYKQMEKLLVLDRKKRQYSKLHSKFLQNQPNFCVPTINLMERSQGVAGGHQGRVLVINGGHTLTAWAYFPKKIIISFPFSIHKFTLKKSFFLNRSEKYYSKGCLAPLLLLCCWSLEGNQSKSYPMASKGFIFKDAFTKSKLRSKSFHSL